MNATEIDKGTRWSLEAMMRGCGIEAKRRDFSTRQWRELKALEAEGIIRWARNHSGDRVGMFIKTDKTEAFLKGAKPP